MTLVKMKEAVNMFGLKDGLEFWWNINFYQNIQSWFWLNITGRPYCLWAGWHCINPECTHEHLLTKKAVVEHWAEMKVKMNEVIQGDNGKCAYCGEDKGTVKVPNPNFDEVNQWLVCETCNKVIRGQQGLSMASMIGDEKLTGKYNADLQKIAEESGKPIINAQVMKNDKGGYDTASVEFTGEKDDTNIN
jgi:hypothetical protein